MNYYMNFEIGIDVGGTFTDFFLVDDQGNTDIYKTPTIHEDPAQSVMNGLHLIAEDKEISLNEFMNQVRRIIHGTTITTNAVLTGNTAKTGFLTTHGFRDVLGLRRGLKERQYDLKYEQPESLVPRWLIEVAKERIDSNGKERLPLDEEDVRKACRNFRKENVQAIGICFIFSFKDPSHEQRAVEIIQEEMPGLYISSSSEVLPQIRLYERCSTTALNAATGPILSSYLNRLNSMLQDSGFKGILLIMQSNGGVMSPTVAQRFSVNTVLSGPAGGPEAALFYTHPHNFKNLITIDMGGTSFDACLIKNREPLITTEGFIGEDCIALPLIDISTIGAGGGSIAWIDTGGLLQVGPQSAGAHPGPVCYGRGGTLPTVTDADLILGYLNPTFFHGGKMVLDYNFASNAINTQIAEPLKMPLTEAANGIFDVINSKMADALSVISVERGLDPRDFTLIVAGGAGPIHAASIANELGIKSAFIPRNSSVFCAFGMQMCDIKHDYVRTYPVNVSSVDFEHMSMLLKEMINEGTNTLTQEGIKKDNVNFTCSIDMRYIGQFNEVEVPFSSDSELVQSNLDKALLTFHNRHDQLYGYSLPEAGVEIINLRVSVKGITEKPEIQKFDYVTTNVSVAQKGYREVFFKDNIYKTIIYDGELLAYGHSLEGPAIVEQETTNIVVPPQWKLSCDEYNNFIINNV